MGKIRVEMKLPGGVEIIVEGEPKDVAAYMQQILKDTAFHVDG